MLPYSEYKIVTSLTLKSLQSEVNALLKEGWQLVGGPFQYRDVIDPDNTFFEFAQALEIYRE